MGRTYDIGETATHSHLSYLPGQFRPPPKQFDYLADCFGIQHQRDAVYFLVIDNRFGVPIYVFLEHDPNSAEGRAKLRGRWVTLELTNSPERLADQSQATLGTSAAIGGDPNRPDRYAVFASEGAVRAAGFSLIEPRYMGPTWETYLSVFHPEGGKRNGSAISRPKVGR